MLKIYHIHSNPFFVNDVERYDFGADCMNVLIILYDKKFDIKYNGPVYFFKRERQNVGEILKHLENADLIVINDLDWIKSIVVNRVKNDKKIVWRFFGYELYQRKAELFLSDKSKAIAKNKSLLHRILSEMKVKEVLKKIIFQRDTAFFKAVRKIDGILLFSREEYEVLKCHWVVPPFIQLPLIGKTEAKTSNDKDPVILIGNSRSIYNNHPDVLYIIKNSNNPYHYQFKLLFNYGGINTYSQAVKEYALGIADVSLVEELLPLQEFENFYESVAALVINGYRQMALGNIFIALKSGVKLYLNRISPIYAWLVGNGFHVSSIDELEDDLNNDTVKLTLAEANFNINRFNRLTEEYSIKKFYDRLITLVNEG